MTLIGDLMAHSGGCGGQTHRGASGGLKIINFEKLVAAAVAHPSDSTSGTCDKISRVKFPRTHSNLVYLESGIHMKSAVMSCMCLFR